MNFIIHSNYNCWHLLWAFFEAYNIEQISKTWVEFVKNDRNIFVKWGQFL